MPADSVSHHTDVPQTPHHNTMIARIVIVACVIAAVCSAPQGKEATIVSYENENIGVDGYKFSYETSDGVKRSEEGTLKNAGSENEAMAVQGNIQWTGPDGKLYTITFQADENGYRPVFTS